ncbi:MAG: HDOD domain-containing protein [Lachnospiraceae bacterium]|nr:HDOD domain-containing protein [Lachnospiraceae bacterium]
MIFVKTDDLKEGMRLAKPIYNRNGVMLYDRNSKLTMQGINSIRNFELIGIFILEPAEPLPPMTVDDIEFERFQTMAIFSLKDNLKLVLEKQNSRDLLKLANLIMENYGKKRSKLQFVQNLRSKQDYVYRHTLNVAILCGLIAGAMELPNREKLDVIMAGLLHDVGKLLLPKEAFDHIDSLNDEENKVLAKCKEEAYQSMLMDYDLSPNARIMVAQFTRLEQGDDIRDNTMRGTRILSVAEVYDYITAIKMGDEEAMSSVQAIKYLKKHESEFGADVIEGLMSAIQILVPGVCVTMSNGSKGLVIEENKEDVMRPVVLDFNTHMVYNLADDSTFSEIQVADVMKTMDNRYVMDRSLLDEYSGKLSYKRREDVK